MQLRHPHPPLATPHSWCHSTLKTRTKTPLLPAGMSSPLAVQFLNHNYQLLPPQLHRLLLDMLVALTESLSPSPSALGLASPLSHTRFLGQTGCMGDAIWLPADASPPLPSLQCPGLSQEMEAPAPVCSFSQEGARLPTVVQRAVHARLSCKAHGFGATQARSQLLQAASSGFLFKSGSAPLPQSHCGSAGTCANPLPACHTRVCLDRDFGGSCIPPVRAPDPLAAGSTHSAVPPLPLAGHQLFTSPACDFRSMAFMMFSGALSCRAGSGQGHCTQSGSCKLKPARDKLKTKGQRCAGQERLGFAFLLLQKPQHGCHGHGHAQVPAGITLNIPQGPDLAPQGRMLRAAQPAALGPWLLPPLPSPTDSVQSIFARNRAGTMQL